MNSFEHFPTIGVINKLDDSIYQPIDHVQRTNFIGSFILVDFDGNDLIHYFAVNFFSKAFNK
jgi:hypothetical protein